MLEFHKDHTPYEFLEQINEEIVKFKLMVPFQDVPGKNQSEVIFHLRIGEFNDDDNFEQVLHYAKMSPPKHSHKIRPIHAE